MVLNLGPRMYPKSLLETGLPTCNIKVHLWLIHAIVAS